MSNQLNPDIKEIFVGIRQLRKIYIYPLSMQDQFDLVEKLADAINTLGEGFDFNQLTNEEAIEFFRKLLTDNITTILEYVTDEDERPSFNQLTNNQLFQIVETIFSVNFEGILKNSMDLFQRFQKALNRT